MAGGELACVADGRRRGGKASPPAGGLPPRDTGGGSASHSRATPLAGGLPPRHTGGGSASHSKAPPPMGGLPLRHTGGGSASHSKAPPPVEGLPPRHTGGGSASHREQKLCIFCRDGAILWKLIRGRDSRSESAEGRQRAAALPLLPRFAINE